VCASIRDAVSCSESYCVVMCCSVSHGCSVLQCVFLARAQERVSIRVTVSGNELQRVAVCCNVCGVTGTGICFYS